MRIFCMIMVMLFAVVAVLATINVIVEWNGQCDNCTFGINPETGEPYVGHHPTQCGVLMSSRIKSIFIVILLYMCTGTWIYLFIDACADEKRKLYQLENKISGNMDYISNMNQSIERKQ